jgi:hypothetical protein
MPRLTIRDKDGKVTGYIDTEEPYDSYNPPENQSYTVEGVDHLNVAGHLIIFSFIIAFFASAFESRAGCAVALAMLVFGVGYIIVLLISERKGSR